MLTGGLKMPLSIWMPISGTASALFVTVIGGCGWIVGRAAGGRAAAEYVTGLIQGVALVGFVLFAAVMLLMTRRRRGKREQRKSGSRTKS
jgi:membrane protein DedA with SNARE-associated domain